MTIIHVLIILIVLGIVWWIAQQFILPHVAEPFRTIIIVVVALLVILWLLSIIYPGITSGTLR